MLTRRNFNLALSALGAGLASGSRANAPLRVTAPPVLSPVRIQGQNTFTYELLAQNLSEHSVCVGGLLISDRGTTRPLVRYSPEEILRRCTLLGDGDEGRSIPPGRQAIIYLEFPTATPLPAAVGHALTYSHEHIESVAVTESFVGSAPISLGAPVRGGPWAAVYHPAWRRGHRRVVNLRGDSPVIPGRFAIDWVRLDANGMIAAGDVDIPTNHLAYGADVLAVADAPVVATRDGVLEARSIAANPAHSLSVASGNYIILRLAPQRFALYEHLRPNSLRVDVGDVVCRGQSIASIGFSGDSTGPHLHFHVAQSPSPVEGDGAPFVIDQFTHLGAYEDIANLGRERWRARAGSPGGLRRQEHPASNAVVRF